MPTISPPSDQLTASESFFGLSARPFSLTPDLRFAYQSRSHAKALEQVTEALQRREGLVVITGEIGTGKTMLCRALLGTFEPRTFLSVILDPCLTVDDLLHRVLVDFGLIAETARPNAAATETTRHQLVTTLQRFLASLIPLGAHAVIMVDEAQHLSPTVLEEIRLLSNFETDDAKLLQIVLVGQPDLDHVLRRPDMQQLAQRIARRCELHPLADNEVQDYIERRLLVAAEAPPRGKGEPPPERVEIRPDADRARFTPAAIRTVADISHGIPRVINTLCDRALEVAFELQTRSIDRPAVMTAAERLKLPVPAAPSQPDRTRPLAVGAVLLAIVAAGLWWFTQSAHDRPSPVVTAPVKAAPPQPTAVLPPPATAPPSSAPSDAPVPAPVAAAPAAPAAPVGTASAPSPGAGRFDIAVAAFRTAGRAAEVAAGLTKAGIRVSIRTDSTGGWHQIVAGPYRSAEEAAVAQRVLAREGFTGLAPRLIP